MDRVMIIGLAASIGALVLVLELVRRRKLREDYSLLWLGTALILIVLSASRPMLDTFAGWLGIITYPPAALFLIAILFVLLLLLHFSTVLTKLTRENREMAQQLALLRWQLSQTVNGSPTTDGNGRDGEDAHQGANIDEDRPRASL